MATGIKTIEIRKWNTNYKGDILIHASKNVDKGKIFTTLGDVPRGAIIAHAELVDVIKYDDINTFMNDINLHLNIYVTDTDLPLYGFILKDIQKIKAIPFKGQLNIFETKLSWMDIRILKYIEYLKCKQCGHPNELERDWRSRGDMDDTHYIKCEVCHANNSINNLDRTSPYLVEGIYA